MTHVIVPILSFYIYIHNAYETEWGGKQHTDGDNATINMSETSFTIICLVEGEPIERAFPVDIEPSDLVGALKERIKEKKANDFQHIDADKLTLFRYDHPVNVDSDESVPLKETIKLSAITKVGKYFPSQPQFEQIHVIVRYPAGNMSMTQQYFFFFF